MKNLILAILCVCSCNNSLASSYKISPIHTDSIRGAIFHGHGINDNGQVFGLFDKDHQRSIYVSDSQGGLFVLSGRFNSNLEKLKLNNFSALVGTSKYKIVLWNLQSSIQLIDIFDHSYVIPIDFNDKGQIIGKSKLIYDYEDNFRPFLWDNGIATDMGPDSDFALNFEAAGYHVMSISLTSINNNSEIAGYFSYGRYNEKRGDFVSVGRKAFFWNGSVHIIPLPYEIEPHHVPQLNNTGSVLTHNYSKYVHTSYLWNVESGLHKIPDFHGFSVNDSDVVLGNLYSEGSERPAIWGNEVFTTISELLGNKDLSNMASPFSDTYEIEQIKEVSEINSKGQIVALGFSWGEWHPCIIEPAQEEPYVNPWDEVGATSNNSHTGLLKESVYLGNGINPKKQEPFNQAKYTFIKQKCLLAAESERTYWQKATKDIFLIRRKVSAAVRHVLNRYKKSYPAETNKLLDEFIKSYFID